LKEWFKNRFLDLIALIMISYVVYNFGYNMSRFDFMVNVDKCTDSLFNKSQKNGGMKKFYGHKKHTTGNIWNHAEALTELEWAQCFRKEINK
jgi:hypothetical protein